jgi:peptidoglycan/LPS O-acetylase OafA/YrhL
LVIAAFLMMLGVASKVAIIGIGGMLLAPCLLAYLFGMPFPGSIGKYLAWIGERTYSIYLWQQPLTICGFLPTVLHPAGALMSIIIGAYSFNFFERPFLSANRIQQPVEAQLSAESRLTAVIG